MLSYRQIENTKRSKTRIVTIIQNQITDLLKKILVLEFGLEPKSTQKTNSWSEGCLPLI